MKLKKSRFVCRHNIEELAWKRRENFQTFLCRFLFSYKWKLWILQNALICQGICSEELATKTVTEQCLPVVGERQTEIEKLLESMDVSVWPFLVYRLYFLHIWTLFRNAGFLRSQTTNFALAEEPGGPQRAHAAEPDGRGQVGAGGGAGVGRARGGAGGARADAARPPRGVSLQTRLREPGARARPAGRPLLLSQSTAFVVTK